MKKFNKYKFISHAVMMAFIILSTIQTLLDAEHVFTMNLDASIFIVSIAASIVPITILTLVMNMIGRKTKHVNLFVVPEIKSTIKILFYLSVFGIFTMWSILLIAFVGNQFETMMPVEAISKFLLSKVLFSVIYSFIVSMFFNGLSGLKIGKRSRKDGV
jgi:hypothetical protein